MPNIQSAKKRMRQSAKRRARNRSRKTGIKTYTKKVTKAIDEKNVAEAEAEYREMQARLDKAAKARTIGKVATRLNYDLPGSRSTITAVAPARSEYSSASATPVRSRSDARGKMDANESSSEVSASRGPRRNSP